MTLTFTVTVEARSVQDVPYLKHLLMLPNDIIGRTTIHYEEWLTKKDRDFETIERDADDRGRL